MPDAPFKDAEAWLAARGVTRDEIRVSPPTGDQPPEDTRTPVGTREAARLANEAPPSAPAPSEPLAAEPNLEDQVTAALAFTRRSTAQAPKSEQRVRDRLAGRGYPQVVIDLALKRARQEGLVDDPTMVAALVDEGRGKGHAPLRIRMDLRRRGFPDEVIDPALEPHERADPEAQAFEVARRKAASTGALEPETAFRRLVGFLARRGYTEGLARKVAREVVYADREQQRIADR